MKQLKYWFQGASAICVCVGIFTVLVYGTRLINAYPKTAFYVLATLAALFIPWGIGKLWEASRECCIDW